jgi:hypothetical protein
MCEYVINPLVGTIPTVGKIDCGVNTGAPIILLLPIQKNTIMTEQLFKSSGFGWYIGVCTLRSIVLAVSAILWEELKNRKIHDFQKCFLIYSISTNFRQNHFLSLGGKSVDHLSVFRISNDMISFKSLGIYLAKSGVIERVQWIAELDQRSFEFEIFWLSIVSKFIGKW